tara:strand:- start:843 stop:1082 length:240 start_codon:yes stop_codon:yes gene_type:complete
MIEYFTALVLTYHVQGEAWKTKVLYDRERYCQEAMDSEIAMPLYNQIFEIYGNNIIMKCVETNLASYIIKPKSRPKKNE